MPLPVTLHFALAAAAVPQAQLSLPETPGSPPPTLEESRLAACLDMVNQDPSSAIAQASQWSGEERGAGQSYPLQCLGVAYSRVLRWRASAEAFEDALGATLDTQNVRRAQLGVLAGVARLENGEAEAALAHFDAADAGARRLGRIALAGSIARDRAMALATLGRLDEAGEALAVARRDDPQAVESWLASARFARERDDLLAAQGFIQTAATMAPREAAVGLEAGIIAALDGRDEAARASFLSVIEVAPHTPLAERAAAYLAQLDALATP